MTILIQTISFASKIISTCAALSHDISYIITQNYSPPISTRTYNCIYTREEDLSQRVIPRALGSEKYRESAPPNGIVSFQHQANVIYSRKYAALGGRLQEDRENFMAREYRIRIYI